MRDYLTNLFGTSGFMPHGYCFAWQPHLLWPMAAGQAAVALAYISISVTLVIFLRRQPNIRYRWVFLLFGAFIFACAVTHVLSLVNIWYPMYRLDVAWMLITAGISVATATMLWPLMPEASRYLDSQVALQRELLDTNAQLEKAMAELERRNQTLDGNARRAAALSRLEVLLQSCLHIPETGPPISSAAQTLFPGCSGSLYLVNPSRNYLECAAEWGDQDNGGSVISPKDCWALRQGSLVVTDLSQPLEPRCTHIPLQATAGTALCIPMSAQGEMLGFLTLLLQESAPHEGQREYPRGWIQSRLATELADRISVNIANIHLRETLSQQSIRDSLSGLFNRRYLEETLTREIARADRAHNALALLMIDIDHFKHFNDRHGHALGDWVIKQVSAVLQHECRGSDVACRYGGEEFVVALFDLTPEQAVQRADRMRIALSEIRLPPPLEAEPGVTVSIGVSTYPDDGTYFAGLLASADKALYRAKQSGRNSIITAESLRATATGDDRSAPGPDFSNSAQPSSG